jgi:hypothetical protein
MTNPPPEFPTRAEIRATATDICEQITLAAAAGENPRQMSLDLLDQQARYSESLGPDNMDRYLDMLSQEIEAIDATAVDRQRKVDEAKLGNSAWLLGVAFGAVIGLPLLLRACS